MRIVPKRPRGRPRCPDVLTPAEWRVMAGLRVGKTNAEIARDEHVSVHTVRTHVSSRVLKKPPRGDRRLIALGVG
jgi:DNA-binding NarL/FixJ family response regulator